MPSLQKTIYLVRHAECENNIGLVKDGRSPAESPLTEKGLLQAAILAERCAKLDFNLIISSTTTRARQTTEIILAKKPGSVEYSDLFVERVRPSITHPLSKNDQRRRDIEDEIVRNFHLPGYRHSDEENFEDLRDRALEVLHNLASRPEKDILVITHGMIMKVIAACAIFGDQITGMECSRFMGGLHVANTGITVFKYDPDYNRDKPWRLWIWNDHAHLG